jgi:hypothetical protein
MTHILGTNPLLVGIPHIRLPRRLYIYIYIKKKKCTTHTHSAAALSRAAAEKTHQGYTLYPGLVEAKTVEMLLSDAQAATAWSNIFNDNKKRSVAAASPLGRNVAKAIHQFLTETACILDSFQHAKVLMQHNSNTASFLRSEAGCAEQPPHRV